jgi:hypothetical protein
MATKIIISRKSEWINKRRDYKIFIDGSELGKLANGTSEEFTVTPGTHKLQCKINWCSSPEVELELKEGETKFLKTGSAMKFYTVGYVILLLIIISPFIFRKLNIELPANYSIIQAAFVIPYLLYIVYYLTLAKNRYAFLIEDKDNFFN